MTSDGFTVPIRLIAGYLAPTMAELDSGFDLHGWIERERNLTPAEREERRHAQEAHYKAEHDANLVRWQRVVDTFPPGGVRTVLEMHSPSAYGSCEGHDDASWPCAEFEALEGDA